MQNTISQNFVVNEKKIEDVLTRQNVGLMSFLNYLNRIRDRRKNREMLLKKKYQNTKKTT